MLYRLLADAVLLIHLAFILFIIFGGFATWRRPRLIWLHVPCVAYGIAISLVGWVCPLTPLENRLRGLAGDQGYSESFIEHYLLAVIYPPGLTDTVRALLASALVLLLVIAYLAPLLRGSDRPTP